MSGDVTKPGGSYDELLNQGIDQLNREQSFGGTDLKPEEKIVKTKKLAFEETWFRFLAALAIFNLILFFYYKSSSVNALTIEQAEKQLQDFFGTSAEDLDSAAE